VGWLRVSRVGAN